MVVADSLFVSIKSNLKGVVYLNFKRHSYLSICLIIILIFSSMGGLFTSNKAKAITLAEAPIVTADHSVQFQYDSDLAKVVKVAGSFTDWQNGALPMEKDENNRWSLHVPYLSPGVYSYKFIVDDEWITDPSNSETIEGNSKLIVPGLNLDDIQAKMEKKKSYPLSATLIEADGSITKPKDVVWSLKTPNHGVEIKDQHLVIGENADETITLIAEKDGERTEKKIEIVGDMYSYTINYFRLDEDYDKWDLWIFNSGLADAGYSFTDEISDTYKFTSGTLAFPENSITIIPRKGNWEAQDTQNTISVPEGQHSTEAWVIEGLDKVFYSKDEAIKTITALTSDDLTRRHIQLMYNRPDRDYKDWNLWVWGTGVKDDQIDFETQTANGLAASTINVSEAATSVGFILRKGYDWDTAIKEGNSDRYIDLHAHDLITKVYVTSGEEDIYIVPEVTGPVLNNGNATFYFRDKDLYAKNEMSKVDKVQLKLDGQLYDMTKENKNERFVYTLENLSVGTYTYSFLVTIDGIVTEVTDPYNTADGKSIISYDKPVLDMAVSVLPKEVTYNDNAVLSINLEKGTEVEEMYADFRSLGGKEKVEIDPQLNELTIAIDQNATTGLKKIPVHAIDKYGNIHTETAEVTVKARQTVGTDDFDWDEARIYFMLTDRFFDGDSSNNDPYGIGYDKSKMGTYQGGDFKGITKKLDYLGDLGINTIWINPIVENVKYDVRNENPDTPYYAYHGYWASNFEQLNPHYGTMEDFHELIDEAHARGIKIMVDVVVNHAGYGLKESDAVNNGKIANFPTDTDRERFSGMFRDGGNDTVQGELSGLPDFLTEDSEVREQIIQWQTDWIERSKTSKGNTIDYFRVDTVKHVEDTTWMSFKNELTKVLPSFKLIGEAWGAQVNDDQGYLNSGMMDSLLDFDFKNLARDFANGDIFRVQQALEDRNDKLTNTGTLGQFLGSHDEDGFLESVNGDSGKLMLASALQITSKGQPVIYYGEELGLSGKNNYPYYDNRYNIDWESTKNNKVLSHYTKLLNARKEYSKVFSKGTRTQVAGSDEQGYVVFERSYLNENVLVGLNTKEQATEVTFDVPYSDEAVDLYSGKTYTVKDRQVTLTIPARQDGGTVLLVAAGQENPETPSNPELPDTDEELEENESIPEYPSSSEPGNSNAPSSNPDKVDNEEIVNSNTEPKNGQGNTLPNTATSFYNLLLIGIILLVSGIYLVIMLKKKKSLSKS